MDWQSIVVAVLVGLAAAFLARRAWLAWQGRSCRSTCENCGQHSTCSLPQREQLVQLRVPEQPDQVARPNASLDKASPPASSGPTSPRRAAQ